MKASTGEANTESVPIKSVDILVKPCYNTHIATNKEHTMTGLDFVDIRIGGLFHLNGNDYVKQSTRTARMLSNGRIFYFGKTEHVHPIAW